MTSSSLPDLGRALYLLDEASAAGDAKVLGWAMDSVMLEDPQPSRWGTLNIDVEKGLDYPAQQEDHVLVVAFRVPRPDEMSFDEVISGSPRREARRSDPTANTPGLVSTRGAKRGQSAGALAVAPKSGTKRWLVLQAYAKVGEDGLTDDELCDMVGMDYSNVGPRRRELIAGGWVRDTGRERASKAGVMTAVYEVVPGKAVDSLA